MSEIKNIDRLFQEKLKDFEVKPSEDVWGTIEAKLDEKKRRRIIPFWWKLSGVAAVFLIGFLISKSFYNEESKPQNPVVNENNFDQKNQKNNGSSSSSKAVVQTSNKIEENVSSEEKNNTKKTIYSSKSSVAERNSSSKRSLKNKTSITESVFEKLQNQVAQKTKENKQ